jgi:hypothetical protein
VRSASAAETWAVRLGFAVGLVALAVVVLGGRIAPGNGLPGTAVRFSATPTAILAVSPASPFLEAEGLRPGDAADGRLTLRNESAQRVEVAVRAMPEISDLDAVLDVEFLAGDRTVYSGPLGRLRTPTRLIELDAGAERVLTVRAAVAPWGELEAAARDAAVELELSTEVLYE